MSPSRPPKRPRPESLEASSSSLESSNTSSKRQPASAVASNPNDFYEAMNLNHFFRSHNEFEDKMLTRIYNGVKLPTTVNNAEFTQWSSRVSGQYIVFDDQVLSSDDPYDLSHLKFMLLKLWHHHSLAFRSHDSQYDLRAPVIALMREAFDSKCRKYGKTGRLARASFRTEQELCLPAVPPGTVKAAAVVWMPIPLAFQLLFKSLLNHHVFSAEGSGKHIMLATFVFESDFEDEDAAISQISLDLCSAQHQRRALGFKNHQIYGAVLVGSEFTLYSSEWIEEGVVILATTTAFNLIQFPEFLTLFVFLCRLAEEIYNQVQQMRNKLLKNKKSFTKRLTDAAQNPWRPLEHLPGPKSGGNSQQCGSVDDDFDEEDDDIRGDGQETCSHPLKHSYVKRLRASPLEVKSWANQTTKDIINSPE